MAAANIASPGSGVCWGAVYGYASMQRNDILRRRRCLVGSRSVSAKPHGQMRIALSAILALLLAAGPAVTGAAQNGGETPGLLLRAEARTQEAPPARTLLDRLDSLEGQRRVLLIFAPSRSNEDFGRQRLIAQRNGRALRSRDIVVIEAAAAGRRNGDRLGLTAVRRRFDVGGDSFAVILLGKDGAPVLRSDEPVEADSLLEAVGGG